MHLKCTWTKTRTSYIRERNKTKKCLREEKPVRSYLTCEGTGKIRFSWMKKNKECTMCKLL